MSRARRFSICFCLALLSLAVLAPAAHAWAFWSVDFIGPSTGWVGGEYGFVMKTTNGGKTWVVQHKGGVNDVWSVNFVNASRGWAVSSTDGILRTTNGGKSWSKRSVACDWGFHDLYSVKFISKSVGWAVGGFPDGRWEDTHQPYGTLYSSTNGGRSWSRVNCSTSCPMAVDARSATTVVAVGMDRVQPGPDSGYNVVAKWISGGLGWTGPTRLPSYDAHGGELYAVDRAAGALAVAGGWYLSGPAIARTIDGGLTWTLTTPPALTDVRGIKMATSLVGYAVGQGSTTKLLKTTDGGASWFTKSVPSGSHLWGVDFVTASTGYAVGYREATPLKGLVLKTVNGGTTWKRVR